jgi:PST family polysaccharide transporter
MNFFKTIILSGISTIIKLLSWLVINKIIAVHIGPTGIALIGQFQNLLNIILTFGNGAISNGVTKYVAEYSGVDEKKKNDLISAAFVISYICSLLIGIITFIGSSHFSIWIFKTIEYHSIVKLLGITLTLISTNTILLSIINGLKKIKLFILINIVNSLLSLIITSLLTILYGLFGALLSLVIVQSIILFITLPLVVKKIDYTFAFKSIEKFHYRRLLAFSLMTLVSIVIGSLTQILVRNHIINQFSIKEAGYWQSVWMISSMNLMIFSTALSTYYLPKLSELQKDEELRNEIVEGYKIILPLVFISAFCIFILRDFIIFNLFTPEFSAMKSLFAFQLIGDFLKMASFSLAFLMISKAMTKTFIFTEFIFSFSFYILTVVFVNMNGLEGVTHAYALNYLLYLVTMLVLFRRIIFLKKNKLLIKNRSDN